MASTTHADCDTRRTTIGTMAKKKTKKGGASTPATVQLDEAEVPFTLYEYHHSGDHMDEGYGKEAAEQLGKDERQVCKTLLVSTEHGLVTGVVPVNGHMSMKGIAQAVGEKKAEMAEPKDAMRETGYVVGGISPLGQRTKHRTVIDESVMAFDEVLVSGGKRGLSLGVNPHDLYLGCTRSLAIVVKVLDAVVAPIATDKKSY